MIDYKKIGYNSKLFNEKSPLAQPLGQDALQFDGRFIDTGISAGNLKDSSVTTTKIAGGAVTQNKIAENSITGTHVIDGGLNGSDLAGSAVAGTHIALNAVTNDKINDYDLAKGTGLFINLANVGTAGTWNASAEFSANGTAGLSAIATIVDRDAGVGTTTHVLTFTYGLLTAYATS